MMYSVFLWSLIIIWAYSGALSLIYWEQMLFQSARNSILQLNNPLLLRHYLFLILIRADKNWFLFSSSLPLFLRAARIQRISRISSLSRRESAAWWYIIYARARISTKHIFIKHSSYLERSISRLFFLLPSTVCAFYRIKKLLRDAHPNVTREERAFHFFTDAGGFIFRRKVEKKRPTDSLWGRNRRTWLIDMHIFAPLLLNLAAAAVVAAQIFTVGDANAP